MSYLDRLKQIEGQKQFAHIPEPVLTKPPKASFVSSGSSTQGLYVKTQSPNVESVQVAIVGAGDTATASRCWLIHYTDREPMQVLCVPDANHAEILEWYPDAVAAEPFAAIIRKPSSNLSADEEKAIRAWLALIEETDPATIAEVLSQCRQDADARDYFTGRVANELPKPEPFPDDRRTCSQCRNLRGRVCSIATPGGLVSANVGYRPAADILQRCAGYLPHRIDTDQRPGGERWPGI